MYVCAYLHERAASEEHGPRGVLGLGVAGVNNNKSWGMDPMRSACWSVRRDETE